MKLVDITALKGKTVSQFAAIERKAPFSTEYLFTCEDGTTYTLKHKANALEQSMTNIERIDGNYHIPAPFAHDNYDPFRQCFKAVKGTITHAERIDLDWQESGLEGFTVSKKTLFLIATCHGVVSITYTVFSYDNESPAEIILEERAS